MKKIKKLYAFDFDDTLAETPSIIGIRRITETGESDPSFRDWLHEMNIDFIEVKNENSPTEIFYMASSSFVNYEKAAKEDLEYISANNFEDQFDFSGTASIDIPNTKPHNTLIDLAKQAYSEPDAVVVVITARQGVGQVPSLSGKAVQATNIADIQQFLKSQGLNLSQNAVTTAGDIGQGAGAKVLAMKRYIEIYNPEEIAFYDDNASNVAAIAAMCKEYYPGIKISAYQIGKEGNISSVQGCAD